MKRMILNLGFAVFLTAITVSQAFAGPYGVSSSTWQAVSGSPGTATFVLPETAGNDAASEPFGLFDLTTPINTAGSPNGIFYGVFTDPAPPTGGQAPVSDYIVWGNDQGTGLGRILFFSDPSLPSGDSSALANALQVFNLPEDNIDGGNTTFQILMADQGNLSVTVASDGESAFDPFGAGFDISDGIRFNNASYVPEPASGLLVLGALGALSLLLRRRRAAGA